MPSATPAAASIRWRSSWRCARRRCPDALVFVDVTVLGALGGRGVHGLPAADLLQPDRQPGDGLVDPGRARRAARPPRPAGGDGHRRRLLPDAGDGDLHGGARGAAGQVLRPGRPGLPLHAGAAAAGLPADDGDASWPGSTTPRWRRASASATRRSTGPHDLDGGIHGALDQPGPVLVRVRDRLRQAAASAGSTRPRPASRRSCRPSRRSASPPASARGRWIHHPQND